MLKSLSEQYARRAREFSDKVALLGSYQYVTPELVKLWIEIKAQHALCSDAEKELDRHIQKTKSNARSA